MAIFEHISWDSRHITAYSECSVAIKKRTITWGSILTIDGIEVHLREATFIEQLTDKPRHITTNIERTCTISKRTTRTNHITGAISTKNAIRGVEVYF